MSSLVGQIILNQFRVDAFVASGGMGTVYRVWDMQRSVPLAMKTLHAELAEDPSMLKRFEREADALTKLAHPHIVPFYGLYHTEDFAFLVQRYVDGPTMKDVLHRRKGQPMSMGEALTYLKALCAALGYAHVHGLVHCDVKPANVMIDRGNNIYLTDFGITRHAESSTMTLATAGTAAYMAPEQIRGEPVSAATDIYALGVMFFEMLTGQRPFRATDSESGSNSDSATERMMRILSAHLNQLPPDPCSLNPAISPQMAQVILKALEKSAQERYPNTQAFFQAACQAAGIRPENVPERANLGEDYYPVAIDLAEAPTMLPTPSEAPNRMVPSVTQPHMAVATPAVVDSPAKRTSPVIWIVGLLVLMAVGVIGAVIFLGRGAGGQRSTTQENVSATLAAQVAGQQTAQVQEVEVARLTAQALEATVTAKTKSVQESQAKAAQNAQAITSATQQQGVQATAQALAATSTAIVKSVAEATASAARRATSAVQVARVTQTATADSSLICNVPDVTGTWQGKVDYKGNVSPFAWKLEQDGCKVKGNDIVGLFYYAVVQGTITDKKLTLDVLYKTEGFCAPHAILEITADRIYGKITNCNGGSFDMTRKC